MDNNEPIKSFVYVLKLENGKYYIGKTNDLPRRLNEHISGNGSAWTAKHKYICVEDVIKSTSQFDEDNYVKEYMMKYGIDNVRGGAYSNITLDDEQKILLIREFRGILNLCLQCGDPNHFVQNCPLMKVSPHHDIKIKTKINHNTRVKNKTNRGAKWTPLEEASLITNYKNGVTIVQLAIIHGRTEIAISSRLKKLGKIS